jgi:hypothetical protein
MEAHSLSISWTDLSPATIWGSQISQMNTDFLKTSVKICEICENLYRSHMPMWFKYIIGSSRIKIIIHANNY